MAEQRHQFDEKANAGMKPNPECSEKIRAAWKSALLLAALSLATVACSERRGDPALPQVMPKPTVHMPAIDDDDAPDGSVVNVPFIVPSRPMPPPPGLI